MGAVAKLCFELFNRRRPVGGLDVLHAKALQARDVGVPVERLRGPVFGGYKKIGDVPSGAHIRSGTTNA